MTTYLRPDVYVENVSSGERPTERVTTSVAGFVGVSRRGVMSTPLQVTSWSEFLEKCALGLDTPFLEDFDLAYAVYGFFQNGGKRAYISRVASDTKDKASVQIPVTTGLKYTALDEGTWANTDLTIAVTDGTVASTFDISIKMYGVEVEKFEGVTNTSTDDNYYVKAINGVSKYITVETGGTVATGNGTMSGGVDGTSDLDDADYTTAMAILSAVSINILVVPGQSSATMVNAITTYCEGRTDCFAILDAPSGQSASDMITNQDSINASDYGALYYPLIKVVDPLSTTGKLKTVPPSGHIAGVYARIDNARGIHKAPAGEESVIQGAVELETYVTTTNQDLLNPLGINSILSKDNIGVVIWGARTLSATSSKRYVSDVRYDIYVERSAFTNTGWAVFEPNDSVLWKRMKESLETFLHDEWLSGRLKGASRTEAFYVKCDADLNTDTVINQGKVIAEIAYAKKKPAEFVVLKIVQKSA